jgi:hypothetical protein
MIQVLYYNQSSDWFDTMVLQAQKTGLGISYLYILAHETMVLHFQ